MLPSVHLIPHHFIPSTRPPTVPVPVPFALMSTETDLDVVMEEWTLPMLKKASESSVLLHRYVANEMKRRVLEQLRKYFVQPDKFLDTLYETTSLISGSTVLGLVYPKYMAFVSDLDIYVANDERSKKMFEYLTTKEGMFPNVSFFVPSFFSSDVSP